MPSLNTVLLATALLLSSAQAQEQYTIDPTSVPLSTRDTWCEQEKSSCPLICQDISAGQYETNDCDPMALTYGCVCENGMSPNLSQYSLTLPFFICQEWGNQCEANCGSDSTCASDCRQNHQCGALAPVRANKTASPSTTPTSSGAASSTSANQVFSGLGDGSGSDSKPKNGASPLLQYGSVVGAVALSAFVGLGSLIL
ncbi:hypothetical protein F4861DRAFT_525729 [Xylaria intraflava]|nr:hypothetical protein F4861DRAFT_525729 [Xylaria intraflava]